MKKFLLLLALALLFVRGALAEDFTLEVDKTISGMNYTSWRQGYAPTVSNDTLTLCLPVSSQQAKGAIQATLIMADDALSPLRPQEMSKQFSRTDHFYGIKLTFKLFRERVNGDYAAIVRIEGADASGGALVTDFPIVIRIRDGKDSAAPFRPEISQLSADFRVGENGTITAQLLNADPYAEMTGIELTVSDSSGEILPQGSNRLPLNNLMPGESCTFSYPMSVQASAAVSLHTLNLTLTYRALGQTRSWEESFTLPVNQTIRLEHGGAELPSSIVQGDFAMISLPLMNMGRGELKNVMATLQLPGLEEGRSVLVGSLSAGETKPVKLTFTPDKSASGNYDGEIQVSCEDAWGNPFGFSVPIRLTVEESAPIAIASSVNASITEEKQGDLRLYGLAGLSGLLLLALMLQGALLRRKIHKLEEDRL